MKSSSSASSLYSLSLESGAELRVEPLRELTLLQGQVSEQEWSASLAFSGEKRRREWLSWRAVAREMLGVAPQIDPLFEYNEVGAPKVVNNPNIYIGVSHSSSSIGVLVSPHPCAIDIDDVDRHYSRVAKRYVSAEESQLLEEGLSLAQLWCAKEALYKFSARKELTLIDDLRVVSRSGAELKCRIVPLDLDVVVQLDSVESLVIAYVVNNSPSSPIDRLG